MTAAVKKSKGQRKRSRLEWGRGREWDGGVSQTHTLNSSSSSIIPFIIHYNSQSASSMNLLLPLSSSPSAALISHLTTSSTTTTPCQSNAFIFHSARCRHDRINIIMTQIGYLTVVHRSPSSSPSHSSPLMHRFLSCATAPSLFTMR